MSIKHAITKNARIFSTMGTRRQVGMTGCVAGAAGVVLLCLLRSPAAHPDNLPKLPFNPQGNSVEIQSEVAPTADGKGAVQTFARLKPGWNLISFQVLPEQPTVENVFAGLAGGAAKVQVVWSFDTEAGQGLVWKAEGAAGDKDLPPGGKKLSRFEYHRGYWVKLSPGMTGTLRVGGQPAPKVALKLFPGWNLVGFDGSTQKSDFLTDIESVFATFVNTTKPDNSRIQTVLLPGTEELLIWDPTNDRPEGQMTEGLPEGNEKPPVTKDTITDLKLGTAYWVLVGAGQPVELVPLLQNILPADVDNPPVGNFPGPEDIDVNGNRRVDKAEWTFGSKDDSAVQDSLVFPADANEQELVIRNAGSGILSWRISKTGGDWLTVTPAEGKITRGVASIKVSVRRGATPGPSELRGELHIQSAGGTRTIPVRALVPDLVGDYVGRAQMRQVNGKSIDMPSIDLFLSLERTADGVLRGQIVAERSLSIPVDVPVAGAVYRDGTTEFVLAGSYELPGRGRDRFDVKDPNPLPGTLRRELRLTGSRSTANEVHLEGELQDTLHGVTSRPVTVSGNFVLERVSLVPTRRQRGLVKWSPVGGTLNGSVKKFPITIPTRTLVTAVRVAVTLDHPRTADLEIDLVGPGENNPVRVRLFDHDKPLPSETGVGLTASWPDRRYPPAGADTFKPFLGTIGEGEWKLEIRDKNAGQGEGRRQLRAFELEVSGPTVYALEGTIRGEGGGPLEGATVAMVGGAHVFSTVSKKDGRYRFDPVTPGLYKLTVNREEFVEKEQRIYLSKNETVDFDLKPAMQTGRLDAHRPLLLTALLVDVTRPQPGIPGRELPPAPGPMTARDKDGRIVYQVTGGTGASAGVIPGTYSATNPAMSDVTLSAAMADATTFDNRRDRGKEPFPVKGVDTDVKKLGANPPVHLYRIGVGRISYALLGGPGGGDGAFDPPETEEGQTWKHFRIVSSIGSPASGSSAAGPFVLLGGGRPFPPQSIPNAPQRGQK